jgi:hypothetical protein
MFDNNNYFGLVLKDLYFLRKDGCLFVFVVIVLHIGELGYMDLLLYISKLCCYNLSCYENYIITRMICRVAV